MAGADKPFPQPRPTALDRLIDSEPTVVDKRPVPTDRCQCCGCTLEAFKQVRHVPQPLQVVDVSLDTGMAEPKIAHLGSLCLCMWCLMGLREHFRSLEPPPPEASIEVERCQSCPFRVEDSYGQSHCRRQEDDYEDQGKRIEPYELDPELAPFWCPLREAPYVVKGTF
jgi:hypothetical protein